MPEFIAGLIWGNILTYLFVEKWMHRDKHPYKWFCFEDDCRFKISSNDQSYIERVAKDHEEKFHSKEIY